MLTIDKKWGTLNPEPEDSGFDQIVGAVRVERMLAERPSLANLSGMAVNESLRSMQFAQQTGQIAAQGGQYPLIRLVA